MTSFFRHCEEAVRPTRQSKTRFLERDCFVKSTRNDRRGKRLLRHLVSRNDGKKRKYLVMTDKI